MCYKNLIKQFSLNEQKHLKLSETKAENNSYLHEVSLESWIGCQWLQLGKMIQMNSPIVPWKMP